jgi:hypothetical protein
LLPLAAVTLVLACTKLHGDGPLPEDQLSIASAAPGAMGALAAGTDAAPPPPRRPRRTWAVPGDEGEEEDLDPEEIDAGPPGAFDEQDPPDMPL